MTAAILAGIVATSAIGSIHCLAMCGPLVGLAGGTRTMRLAATHSLGRLATYTTLGALAGLAGSAIDLAGRLGNLQRAATMVAGIAIVGWGVWALVGRSGGVAKPERSAFARGLVQIRTSRPAKRAYLMGMLTGLLPCGWLWAFVITAAGSAHPLSGALVMVAFWLGTVPAMIGLLGFAGPTIARIRARMPAVTAIALIAIGLGTLALRWRDAGTVQVTAPHCALCHGEAS